MKRANVTIYIHGYLQMIVTNPRASLNGTLIHIFPFEVDLLESNTISNIFLFKDSPPGSSYSILSENTRVGGDKLLYVDTTWFGIPETLLFVVISTVFRNTLHVFLRLE